MRAINLIPSEQRSGQPVGAGRSQGAAYAVLVLVGGLALMAYLYGSAQHQISSRRAQAASLTAQAQQVQAEAERLAPYTSFIALREQRVQAVDGILDSRFDWAHVLHELGRVLPAQASISSLTGTVGGSDSTDSSSASSASSSSASSSASSAASAGVTPPGSVPTFTLAGCATSQPAVALTLERLRLIDGVKEVSLQSSVLGNSSSGGGSASGGCTGHDASFTLTISFAPLPSTSAVAAATKPATKAASKTVSDSTSAGSGAQARTTKKEAIAR
jgi:Tfp pilus assembly protein PilN